MYHYNLSNQSNFNGSIPLLKSMPLKLHLLSKLWDKVPQKQKIPKILRNLKYEGRIGLSKAVLPKSVNCSLKHLK